MPIAARLIAAAALALPAAIAIADDVDAGIARVMAAHVKPGEPGCTVGVAEGGKLTRALAFGLSENIQGNSNHLSRPIRVRVTGLTVSASLALTSLARQTRPPASRAGPPAGGRCPGPHPDSALPRP